MKLSTKWQREYEGLKIISQRNDVFEIEFENEKATVKGYLLEDTLYIQKVISGRDTFPYLWALQAK